MPAHFSPNSPRVFAVLGCAIAVSLGLTACATNRAGTDDPIEQHQIVTELDAGRLRLTCDLACSGTWRAARKALRGLHEQGVWQELTVEVARIGYTSDLGYFYLGRAAEARGRPQAAAVYYRLALATPSKCDGMVFDSCDGIRFPADAQAALARVVGK
jgi:hypothetical protein